MSRFRENCYFADVCTYMEDRLGAGDHTAVKRCLRRLGRKKVGSSKLPAGTTTKAEIEPLIVVESNPMRQRIITEVKVGFDYLNARVEGRCAAHLSMKANMAMFKAIRMFDPTQAAELKVTAADMGHRCALRGATSTRCEHQRHWPS